MRNFEIFSAILPVESIDRAQFLDDMPAQVIHENGLGQFCQYEAECYATPELESTYYNTLLNGFSEAVMMESIVTLRVPLHTTPETGEYFFYAICEVQSNGKHVSEESDPHTSYVQSGQHHGKHAMIPLTLAKS
jgi:hypothetical protein